MRPTHLPFLLLPLALGLAVAGCGSLLSGASLPSAASALDVGKTQSISFSGTGQWFQFGQAPGPTLAWPPFAVSQYSADIDFNQASERVQITRKQIIEPGRQRPTPVDQRVDQYVHGPFAWNRTPVATPQAGTAPLTTITAQPAATAEERLAEIWSTPQGFLKAALSHNSDIKKLDGGAIEIAFNIDGQHRYVGTLNSKSELERIQTWIDTPVLGDTLVETLFSDYKDFNGVRFPTHIVRQEGGHPILDLHVSSVQLNPTVDLPVPPVVANATPPAITVTSNPLAAGVAYLTGGTHHSVVIEQRDHLVLVEAPLNEARSLALIDKLKQDYPGKPIRYVINTHQHFDHSGGLRTFVDLGATIVTHKDNQAFYERAWANAHTLSPDRLAASKKAAKFETFTHKHVLSDGQRSIEIHPIVGNSHNDAFALVYLPAEKVLVEADAYTPTAATTTTTPPNPYTVNLLDNIQALKLDVTQIAALHGPRVVSLADLRTASGK